VTAPRARCCCLGPLRRLPTARHHGPCHSHDQNLQGQYHGLQITYFLGERTHSWPIGSGPLYCAHAHVATCQGISCQQRGSVDSLTHIKIFVRQQRLSAGLSSRRFLGDLLHFGQPLKIKQGKD
jgi:hypothetical protein